MGLFGPSKKEEEARKAAEAKKALTDLTSNAVDNPANASPYESQWVTSMRTNAYLEKNPTGEMAVFWVAFKEAGEKWRVMQYTFLDDEDGGLESKVIKQGVDFKAAVEALGTVELGWDGTPSFTKVDVTVKYPNEKGLQSYITDVDYFQSAAEAEGFAFNQYMEPYRQIEGKVFENARIPLDNLRSAATAGGSLPEDSPTRLRMESGVLGDIFAMEAGRKASLDDMLKAYETLSKMDGFAEVFGSLYLSFQNIVGVDEKFGKVQGMSDEDKEKMYKKAAAKAGGHDAIEQDICPRMYQILGEAEGMGVNVEPWRKLTAECELYSHLLKASQIRSKMEASFLNGSLDGDVVAQVRGSVEAAAEKFTQLGGTQEKVDKLKAWVADPKCAKNIPNWLPEFLTRYHTSRATVVRRAEERQKRLAFDVATMPGAVKPSTIVTINTGTPPAQAQG